MYTVSFLSGKGGVTKTSLARAVAVTFVNSGWETGVIDFDLGQSSFMSWNNRRAAMGHEPVINVKSGSIRDLKKVQAEAPFHLLIADGAAYGSQQTEDIALVSDMIVMSCRFSIDDMEAAVQTMNALVLKGVDPQRFCVVFSGVPEQRTAANYIAAQAYMKQTPYFMVDGFIEQKNSLTDAQNIGLALCEVPFASLRSKIDAVMVNIATRLHELEPLAA